MEPKNPAETTPPAANATETRAAPPPAPNAVSVAEAAVKAERERAATIRIAGRTAKLGEEFVEKLIADGVTVEAARAAMFDELAKRSDAVETRQHTVEVGEEDCEKFVRQATAALICRAGMRRTYEAAVESKAIEGLRALDGDGGELRGMSLLRMAEEFLNRSGIKTRGWSAMEIASKAFMYRSATSMATTGDFPILLEGAARSMMLAEYAIQATTWRRFCGTRTVSNFLDHGFYRSGGFGELKELNEHGEYQKMVLSDGEKTDLHTATKGGVFAITRQVIINDELGAFSDIVRKIGRGSSRTIEKDVYALINANGGLGPTMPDTNPFFHTSRGNINTVGSVMSCAGVDADRRIMRHQKDVGTDDYLELIPRILLIPDGLLLEARKVNNDTYNHDEGAGLQESNPTRGIFADIVDSPRLNNATRRYIFTELSTPAFVVVWLEGSGEAPVLETEQGWNPDGAKFRARLDFAAQPMDPRAAVTNSGVAA